MSNILKIIQFLKGSEKRFITITNQENGKLVGKKDTYLTDIPNEDLAHYLKYQLGEITQPTLVWIELRSKQGPTSKKEDTAKIEVMPPNYQEQAVQLPAVQNYSPAVQEQAPQPNFLGTPALNNNIFGLGFPEIMNMQRKSDQLEDKKEQLADLKEEYKDLKHNYNLKEVENRELLSKLAIAESQKEMAVMLAKNENKSFADSPVFQSLIERAPELLSGIAAMKGAAPLPQAAGLGRPNVSDTHAEFFDYAADNLNENQINYLGSICGFMNNPEFQNDLKLLIQRYASN
ncbi:hypothetical protein [Flavobacterium commune]|uniref:Uncharacterized protein n=1 Tax=Flavobacterium commune TaxID=1306519 RepID=A0A1D9PAJ1_9FLAO|nr:hypothetical protein [Flavobacterium commune]AOZ99598.1 hypothetical protein BIW12_09175 [Flavobacterium commune]